METSVVLHGDVLDHVERRPGTQKGGNCVRSGAEGATPTAQGATRRAGRRERAAVQKRRGRKGGAAQARGGRPLAPRQRRVQCKLQRVARVEAHDDGEQEAPVSGVVDLLAADHDLVKLARRSTG